MHSYGQMMPGQEDMSQRTASMTPMLQDYQTMFDFSQQMMLSGSEAFLDSHRAGKKHPQKTQLDLYKTRMCPLLQEGKCNNGDNCKFAHSESEIRSKPNLSKTKLCEDHQKGWFLVECRPL